MNSLESSVEQSSIQSFDFILKKFSSLLSELTVTQNNMHEIQSDIDEIGTLLVRTEQDIKPFLHEFNNIKSQISDSQKQEDLLRQELQLRTRTNSIENSFKELT